MLLISQFNCVSPPKVNLITYLPGVFRVWQLKKTGVLLVAAVLAFQVIVGSAAATTFYVDAGGQGNYTTIQDAVNAANEGDTIIVNPGVYSERVTVEKTMVIKGASDYPTVVDGFEIDAAGTQVNGFTMKGGVWFDKGAGSCIVQNNKFEGAGVSIGNNYAHGNQTITNNVFTGSSAAISTYDSIYNKIIGNEIQNCGTGIELLYGGGGHVITGNNITNCDVGIKLSDESATIYNNYFNNKVNLQAADEFASSSLNTTKAKGSNVIGGHYIGGNFWSTPSEDGFSQTHLDINGDGIAEEPYNINERNIDYMPLVTPRVEPAPSFPVANFKTNTNQGPAPLSVTFTDLSENIVSRSWDFENDGNIDSTGKTEVHVYTVPGTYTVNLTATNEVGAASKLATITVTEANGNNSGNNGTENNGTSGDNGSNDNDTTGGASSSGSGGESDHHSSGGSGHKSSGGGGGAGGSPEPQKNVDVKELSQAFVTSGKTVQFDFTKNATCVVYVAFDSKKTLGKTTTIAEMLKNKSSLVSELPKGEVYKSFNVWVGNGGIASEKNIENPTICFKVEKSWLENNSIDPASITLNWYNDKKWEQIPVNVSGEDANYLYFTANVSGYSSFAITGNSKSASSQGTSEQQEENLPSIGSVRLTSDTNDTVIKGEPEKSAPGFELVFGVACLLGIFLYRREK